MEGEKIMSLQEQNKGKFSQYTEAVRESEKIRKERGMKASAEGIANSRIIREYATKNHCTIEQAFKALGGEEIYG